MAAAVSDTPADGPAAPLGGDCSASTSPLSAPRPAPAAKRSLVAPRNVGWGVPISEQDENCEPEEPPREQRQQQTTQVQRGHGLPVRAVSASSSGMSGGSPGGPRGSSGGSSFRSGGGSYGGGSGNSFGGGNSYGQNGRQQPKEKTFAPALPGRAKSINDAMAPWGAPAGAYDSSKFGTSREALQEVSMNDLFMGLWSPGKAARNNM